MKKTIGILCTVVLLFGFSVAAFANGSGESGGASASAGPITLTYMSHQDRFNINPKINAIFEKEHPNVKVVFVQEPQGGADTTHNKLVTMLAAKDGSIDTFITDVIWPPELAAAGWLLPLDKWFPKSEQSKYIPAMIDAQTINGHIYGVPWLNDIGHLFYRKDLLQQAGINPPDTWMDLVNTSQKLQSSSMIGYVADFFPDQQLMCNYTEYLWSNNGTFFDANGKIRFTEKPSVDAVQFMADLMNKYKVVQPGITTMQLDDGRVIFTEGRAVFHRNWNYVWAMAQDSPESKISGKIDVTTVPRFPDGPHTTTLGGWSFSVNAYSKNADMAAQLAVFLGRTDVQKIRALESDTTPAILALLGDPDIVATNPVYLSWQKEASNAKARPKSPFYTQVSDVFQRQLQEAILQNKTPQQAMNDAATDIKTVIGQ